MEVKLGKITKAEFGSFDSDRYYMFGLSLIFSGESWGVGDGGLYSANMSPECRYKDGERAIAALDIIEKTQSILADAKVQHVSELIGKPVEVTLDRNMFKSFRILTEVL